jgi:hypothetical protein
VVKDLVAVVVAVTNFFKSHSLLRTRIGIKMKKDEKNIRLSLKNATSALLGTATIIAPMSTTQASDVMAGWEADVALLIYNETDRVSAFEPAIAMKKTYDDESILGFKVVFDALTGASANGAAISDSPQTFTRPSGNGDYVTAAGETPLDDTFKDTRISLSANYETPIGRLNKMVYGANLSNEYDFLSFGGSATYLQDFNERNTTLSAGVSFEYNSIKPVGGKPVPLTAMNANSPLRDGADDTRIMTELLLGVTQIIDRNTLMQFNYGFAISDGYHNDAYKITSVLNDDGSLIAANGLLGTYLYENRPDSRTKHSLYGKIKRFLTGDVADISYRYMWDDWKVASSTIDAHYRKNFSKGWYLEPHVRYYSQDAAEFYHYSLTQTEATALISANGNLSSDYRLGDMTATTIGLKFGFLTPNGNENSVRLEMYRQTPDLNETVDAVILQYNYKF